MTRRQETGGDEGKEARWTTEAVGDAPGATDERSQTVCDSPSPTKKQGTFSQKKGHESRV